MVNIAVDPLSDHVGYHLLHWVISQSGAWYSKVNENLQDNLRSLETGVAVIDDILTPKEDEVPFENQQNVEVEEIQFHQSNDHHLNILNQIINMNINYNRENNIEHRGIRGNVPPTPGQLIYLFFFSFVQSHVWLSRRIFKISEFAIFASYWFFSAKKWTILSFSLNNGNVESLF